MREKRYSKGMKGTQEEEKESYPYFDIYPLEREVIKKYDKNRTLQSINARKSRSAWESGVNENCLRIEA